MDRVLGEVHGVKDLRCLQLGDDGMENQFPVVGPFFTLDQGVLGNNLLLSGGDKLNIAGTKEKVHRQVVSSVVDADGKKKINDA